jgi:hypothetical protein
MLDLQRLIIDDGEVATVGEVRTYIEQLVAQRTMAANLAATGHQ